MNKNDLYRAFNDVDDDILLRSEAPVHRRKSIVRIKWIALAACLVLIISMVGVACAAEVKEYSAAVDFFEQNGLSTDGLSRSDVKAVYRDIATRNFTYDKTAEVLSQTVPGLQIIQDELTPEKLEELWSNSIVLDSTVWEDGRKYRWDMITTGDTQWVDCEFVECILRCYRGNSMLWEASTENFDIDYIAIVSDGLAIWGNYPDDRDRYDALFPWLAKLDNDGNILWEKEIRHDFEEEEIETVVDNGDGTWAVFSMANDKEYLCVRQFDSEGKELSLKKNKVDRWGPIDAIRIKDGYLLQMSSSLDDEKGSLARMDNEGNLLGYFNYEEEDYVYYLEDMVEFGDKVYLSTYAIPKKGNNGGKDELAKMKSYMCTDYGESLSLEERTRMVQENYTAVLLLCDDLEGGTPKNFYSVECSMAGKLKVEGDKLRWDVERIISAEFSPATSAFNICGDSKLYRYLFNSNGIMIKQEDTGVLSGYAK